MRCDALGELVGGDVYVVREVATVFGGIEERAREIELRLRSVCAGMGEHVWSGPAADAFRARLQQVRPDLLKLEESHRLAREAMVEYAQRLEDAQLAALKAAGQAQDALQVRNRAEQDAGQAGRELALGLSTVKAKDFELLTLHATLAAAADPVQQAELVRQERTVQARREAAARLAAAARSQLAAAESARSSADVRLDAARRLLDAARELRDGAGATVVRKLHDAGAAGIQNRNAIDRAWHDFQDFAAEVTSQPWFAQCMKILERVSTALAALSLVVAVFAFPFTAPLVALAVAGALVSGLLFAGTLLRWSAGRASTSDLVWNGAAAALSVVGLRGAAGLAKNHGLGGMIKRNLAMTDNRTLSGTARSLLWRPVTVAPKSSVDHATFPLVKNAVLAFRLETATEIAHVTEQVHHLWEAGHEKVLELRQREECGL